MGVSNRWDDAVIVALGSNLPGGYSSSRELLEAAVTQLPTVGLHVTHRSRWWRSAAWPERTAPEYLNGVVLVETSLTPGETMRALLALEGRFGRRRSEINAPRVLDLDLIAFARVVRDDAELTLPHPRAWRRGFVLGPLADVAPDWTHPVLGLSTESLLRTATVGADARPISV